ncbi:MAG: hydantoinase B/oxoprolinase family protein [Candidatus Hodarchaeota archaeon]
MKKKKIDQIIVEVICNALQSIVEQMGVVLIRSAYSTNIKERRDCSCAIFDSKGKLVALAEHIPIHLGSMQGLMRKIIEDFNSWNFQPDDVIITNDPYTGGGSHLPDVTFVKPVFYNNQLVAFVSNIAHWSDIGGRAPGVGTAGDSTEILQEGLRIPPIRIINKGKIRQDILELILINVRNREERIGDFNAQIASLGLGDQRLIALFRRYGISIINKCIFELFSYSERCFSLALKEVPEGNYNFSDLMDDDGISNEYLPISVEIRVKHKPTSSIILDFSGTASQARGGINIVWAALEATVLYSMKAIFVPDVPVNAGFYKIINIKAMKGSLVNAIEPAPVGGRTDTCQRVVDVIMGAMSKIIPNKIVTASTGATTALIFSGTKSLTGKDFIYVEALGGGLGARVKKDGIDGIQVHITNTSNLPIEAMELEYPLMVLHYGLVPDSCGAGKTRGGLSIRKDFKILKPLFFSGHSDRHKIPPWGLMEGSSGECGSFTLNPETKNEQIINSKISNLLIKKGDILRITTAGGGGFGPAIMRDPNLVLKDYLLGKISEKEAREGYGVILTNYGTVDYDLTLILRTQMQRKEGE